MPSRARSVNENPGSSAGNGHVSEHKRASKQYQTSRFAMEKPMSPRSGQSLKFKEKGKAEIPIRPPYADLPLKFVKNDSNGIVVQTEFPGNEHPSQLKKNLSKEEELIKYMSKVPGYLLRGEKPQDNVLNFGVLDWGRLEKWTNNQSNVSVSERTDRLSRDCLTAKNGSLVSSLINIEGSTHQRGQPSTVGINSSHIVDCPSDEKQEFKRKSKPRITDCHDLKSAKGKAKQSDQGIGSMKESSYSMKSNLNDKVLHTSNNKTSIPCGELENWTEKFKGLRLDDPVRRYSGKQDSVVLLLPKDFSRPGSAEIPPRASLDEKSAEFSWSSFSDIFSLDEIQSEESLPEVQHSDKSLSEVQYSCPLNHNFVTDRDLDLKLDSLIKAHGVELPVTPPANGNDMKAKTSASTTIKASGDLDVSSLPFFADMIEDKSAPRRFSFSEIKMGRSLSFKEGSAHSQLKSTYVGAKSGPAKPESYADCDIAMTNKTNASSRTRNTPFRRLLDPLLRYKALNKMKEHPKDLRMDLSTSVEEPNSEEHEASTVKALLHLTLTSGLPLFKFMVETNNEILASTVKSLSTFGKDDSRWLYTFYSVHKIKKKSMGWKNHKVKPSGFSYNVIGQMKISNPKLPSWRYKKSDEQYNVEESVLYSVDLGKGNAETSELMTIRELAAVVVKIPKETDKNNCSFSEHFSNNRFSNFEEDEMSGHTVVILPDTNHTLPHEGVPSSLINRWRSGGLCDCGGWDVGCKLRILTNTTQEHKTPINAGPSPMQLRCDLFEQGEDKRRRPFFSLVPFREGLFSVEYGAEMSALQAFSICVAIINSQMPNDSLERDIDTAKASMVIRGEFPERLAPHPPLSPVGRV